MQQIVWTGRHRLAYVEEAPPLTGDLAPGTVQVRIRAVGLCSTDVHIIEGRVRFHDPPLVLGHELAGVVEKVGPGVAHVAPGTRVTIDSVVGCARCAWCARGAAQFCPDGYEIGIAAPGGMQDQFRLPGRNVYSLPHGVTDEEAAFLDMEVLAALRKPGVAPGASILILGPGPAGLIAVQLARHMGAGLTILAGTRPERLALGARLGADLTVEVGAPDLQERIRGITNGHGPDMVFDAAGTSSSLALAFDLVANQGKVVLYGLHGEPVDGLHIDRINLKDLTVYGALSDRLGWEDMLSWVGSGAVRLRDLITHRFPFRDAQRAYETIRDRREGAIKAVLFP